MCCSVLQSVVVCCSALQCGSRICCAMCAMNCAIDGGTMNLRYRMCSLSNSSQYIYIYIHIFCCAMRAMNCAMDGGRTNLRYRMCSLSNLSQNTFILTVERRTRSILTVHFRYRMYSI